MRPPSSETDGPDASLGRLGATILIASTSIWLAGLVLLAGPVFGIVHDAIYCVPPGGQSVAGGGALAILTLLAASTHGVIVMNFKPLRWVIVLSRVATVLSGLIAVLLLAAAAIVASLYAEVPRLDVPVTSPLYAWFWAPAALTSISSAVIRRITAPATAVLIAISILVVPIVLLLVLSVADAARCG